MGALLRPPNVRRGDRKVLAPPSAGAIGGGAGHRRRRPLGQRARAVRAAVRAAAARLRGRLVVQEQTEARLQVGRPRVAAHLQGRLQDAAAAGSGAAGAAARLHRAQSAGDAGRGGGDHLRRPRGKRASEEIAARPGVYSLPTVR